MGRINWDFSFVIFIRMTFSSFWESLISNFSDRLPTSESAKNWRIGANGFNWKLDDFEVLYFQPNRILAIYVKKKPLEAIYWAW